LSSTASVSAADSDPVGENDAATDVATVVVDPVVTRVKARSEPGAPFRVVLSGTGFQPGVAVFIGADAVAWPNVTLRSAAKIVLKQGKTLKMRFPKGVAVAIRVLNPDGGETTVQVVR
jgi:hypothetical protein